MNIVPVTLYVRVWIETVFSKITGFSHLVTLYVRV